MMSFLSLLCRVVVPVIKVMLQGTIRNYDFQRNTTLQYWNNVTTIRNNVATKSDATLCCAKNRRCKSSRV